MERTTCEICALKYPGRAASVIRAGCFRHHKSDKHVKALKQWVNKCIRNVYGDEFCLNDSNFIKELSIKVEMRLREVPGDTNSYFESPSSFMAFIAHMIDWEKSKKGTAPPATTTTPAIHPNACSTSNGCDEPDQSLGRHIAQDGRDSDHCYIIESHESGDEDGDGEGGDGG